MQEEHGFLWRAMLETIDIDVAGRRVLDAGCNRGGFLRLLRVGGSVWRPGGQDHAHEERSPPMRVSSTTSTSRRAALGSGERAMNSAAP